ncbi:MAG: hypothetical protein PHX27_00035 [Candidatus ainarchaeum sp.]|nr:hypothetical protein [Candidatus ainarchaeum sp.]
MAKILKKPAEGKTLPNTPAMDAWREEFESMTREEHLAKLKALGLDDDELAEFEEMENDDSEDEPEELLDENDKVVNDKIKVEKKAVKKINKIKKLKTIKK